VIKENNAWLSPEGEGEYVSEEVPYWLNGYGNLAFVLGDQEMIEEAGEWINGVIASQRDDGWFGPKANLQGLGHTSDSPGKPDLWPNMRMLNALQSYYEYSGDERVIRLMTKYFDWELSVPEEDFLPPFWQHMRSGDNLASVYWLYNRTGDKKLLALATKIFRNTTNWTDSIVNWHIVNIVQPLDQPATYYLQSENPQHLAASERNYQTAWGLYGQVPGGMFGGDERCRPGYYDPREHIETCGIVEMMHSSLEILKINGDLKWADRYEDVAFNTLPAATTADFRAFRYFTAPNQIISSNQRHYPKIYNY
jgi:DUF1680 family protein